MPKIIDKLFEEHGVRGMTGGVDYDQLHGVEKVTEGTLEEEI